MTPLEIDRYLRTQEYVTHLTYMIYPERRVTQVRLSVLSSRTFKLINPTEYDLEKMVWRLRSTEEYQLKKLKTPPRYKRF